MSDEMKLSQDEIDALLSGGSSAPQNNEEEHMIADADRDALGEIGNISFGSAATTLSTLLHQRVEITTPEVTVLRSNQVQNDFPKPYVMVTVEYTAGLSGANALAIEINDAKTIADLMMGGDGTNVEAELNDLHLSAVAEAMNQMMGGAATSMSTMFGRSINISPPTVKFVDLASVSATDLGLPEWIVNTAFRLRVGELIDSKIMQLVPVTFAKGLLSMLASSGQSVEPAEEVHSAQRTEPSQSAPAQSPLADRAEAVAPTSAQAQSASEVQPLSAQSGAQVAAVPTPSVSVQKPEFVDFGANSVNQPMPRNLSLLYDVNLNVTVELGRTRKPIRDILDLAAGSILELDKLAGEPVDILVNNKRIAVGEVVVIDENFGVRVTDIISQSERVRNIQ
jgi:flagellar motor switch protein FliN/FliY